MTSFFFEDSTGFAQMLEHSTNYSRFSIASAQEENYSTIHLRNNTSVLNFLPQRASDGQM